MPRIYKPLWTAESSSSRGGKKCLLTPCAGRIWGRLPRPQSTRLTKKVYNLQRKRYFLKKQIGRNWKKRKRHEGVKGDLGRGLREHKRGGPFDDQKVQERGGGRKKSQRGVMP